MKIIFTLFFSLILINPAQAQMSSFADLAEKLTPSVVNISTTVSQEVDPSDAMNGIEVINPEVRDFLLPKTEKNIALGSGFIVDTEGYIVTNGHVIENAESIAVILHDNTRLEALVIGKDKMTDLALIKVATNKVLTPVTLGDSDKIRVGDWILAIGNPFGLGGSVSAGIISAKSRDIESGPYDKFIQTDASINQGSSGGPMFNMDGEVIGINTAIFSTNGANMGVGFAIPTELAKWVIEQLKSTGVVNRGWIGVKIQPVSSEIASNVGLDYGKGVLVSAITSPGPAQRGGVQSGDIILSFDGSAIDDTKNFSRMVAETKIGKAVKIEVFRGKETKPLNVLIEKMPEEQVKAQDIPETKAALPAKDGSIVIDDLGIKVMENDRGFVISEVFPNTDAAAKGLKEGDLIIKIDNKDVLEAQDITNYISEARQENNRPVLLLVQTLDVVNFVAVKLK